MNKCNPGIIVLLTIFLFTACNRDKISVFDLSCEHLQNPLGIDVKTPRFSWKYADETHTRGLHQTAYRILVATDPSKLKAGKADKWDSGIIHSDQSQLVLYEGSELQSGGDYYWNVEVYTDPDAPACKSLQPARFSMGLLHESDWKGEWIKHPSASSEKQIWFRKKFTVNDKAASAFAYIASVGYHELYVNGQKVDEYVLAPAVSRIDKRVFYVTYDLTPYINKGDNVMALWYGPGWSRNNSFERLVNQTVLVQLDGTTQNGEHFGTFSDKTWKCSESYSSNLGGFSFMDMGGEKIDGRLYAENWNVIDYDDSQWPDATSVNNHPILSAQMTNPSRIIDTIPAQQIIDTIPGVWRVDMGKSFTGFLEAGFDGLKAGDTVVIQISNRTNAVEEHRQKQLYIARGENGEKFRNRFNFFGGRYIHFTGLKQAPKLSDITAYAVSSAGRRTGSFECSDSMFNRIYEIDRRTYEMCNTEGVTVDCPNRERLGYGPEGAYQTTWGLGLPCFASSAYYIKWVRDWSDVQHENGYINNVAPQISVMYGSALNGNANMNIAWEHYQAYGDTQILEEAFKTGTKWIGFLLAHTVDGMLTPYAPGGYFLGEWLRPGPVFEYGGTEQALFVNNCIYAMTLDLYIRIAEILQHKEEAVNYRKNLQTLRTKLHEKYFDPAVNSYLDGDQVRTAWALFTGIVPDSLYTSVLEHLEKDMTGEHPYFNIGSFSRYPYFHVLFAHPQFMEIISNILSKTTYPSYGYFIADGQTTWPETWEINQPNCAIIHTSYAGISSWFIKCLAGIEPTDTPEGAGYRSFTIRPRVIEKLSYAQAELESPYGAIKSGWRKDGDKIIYNITVPAGSNADIYLDLSGKNAKSGGVTENGLPLSQVAGIKVEKETNELVLIHAEAGAYTFFY
jgi:alpha-L-rhamnosidase